MCDDDDDNAKINEKSLQFSTAGSHVLVECCNQWRPKVRNVSCEFAPAISALCARDVQFGLGKELTKLATILPPQLAHFVTPLCHRYIAALRNTVEVAKIAFSVMYHHRGPGSGQEDDRKAPAAFPSFVLASSFFLLRGAKATPV